MSQPQTPIPSPTAWVQKKKQQCGRHLTANGTMWKVFNHGQKTPPHVQSFLRVIPTFLRMTEVTRVLASAHYSQQRTDHQVLQQSRELQAPLENRTLFWDLFKRSSNCAYFSFLLKSTLILNIDCVCTQMHWHTCPRTACSKFPFRCVVSRTKLRSLGLVASTLTC